MTSGWTLSGLQFSKLGSVYKL